MTIDLTPLDNRLIDRLQDGIEPVQHPFRAVADELGIDEEEVIERIRLYLADGLLTRFGPLFNIDRMGGEFCLCAMAVPQGRFEEVAAAVNGFAEVAHNYERDHRYNMWFVLATENATGSVEVAGKIEKATGLEVVLFPKEAEYFIGLKVPA